MTQEDSTLNIKQTTIPYDYNVLIQKLDKQMDIIITLSYKYSIHQKSFNYNKYLFAILKNIQNITESLNRHYEVTDEEFKVINEKIEEIRKVLKNELGLKYEKLDFDDLMGILLNDLVDIIFNLNLWEDDDIEETLDNDNDDGYEEEDDEFIKRNSHVPDHASIINIENDNKKRKCNDYLLK